MSTRLRDRRTVLGVLAMAVVVLAGAVYVGWTIAESDETGGRSTTPTLGNLLFVDLSDGRNRVRQVGLDGPGGDRVATDLECLRVHTSAGVTACSRLAGPGPSYAIDIRRDGVVVRTVGLPGVPSRARVSGSGQVVAWTSFVRGDSYATPGGFSTRTGFLDLRTGTLSESIEDFTAEVAGGKVTASDVNYWGLTVASDNRTFYATLATGGKNWLVKGDLLDKVVRSIDREGECPSLSADGSKLAFKKRIGRFGPWDLAVLDLATGQERRLPGTAGIDDQATWIGEDRLTFAGLPRDAKKPAVYVVAADGSEPAAVVITDATSPGPVG